MLFCVCIGRMLLSSFLTSPVLAQDVLNTLFPSFPLLSWHRLFSPIFLLLPILSGPFLQAANFSSPFLAQDVFNETRSILEPAGAVAVAGAKAWLKHHGHSGKTVVAVTSGANMNFDRLRLVAELADVGVGEAMLAVSCRPLIG